MLMCSKPACRNWRLAPHWNRWSSGIPGSPSSCADLSAARWLREQQPLLEPSANFLASSRWEVLRQVRAEKARHHQSLSAASQRTAPAFGLWEFFNWLRGNRLAVQLVSVLLIVVLLLGSFSGAALAARSSIPGETLYPLKTSVEDLRLLAAFDPVNDAGLNLDFAGDRVGEMQLLVALEREQYLELPSQRYERQVDAALLDLTGVVGSRSSHQVQRAQQLAVTLPGMLAEHAENFDNLVQEAGTVGQPALQHARQFAIERQAVSARLLASLEEASGVVLTATPTGDEMLGGLDSTATLVVNPPGIGPLGTPTIPVPGSPTLVPTGLSPFGPTATDQAGNPLATSTLPAGVHSRPTPCSPPATRSHRPTHRGQPIRSRLRTRLHHRRPTPWRRPALHSRRLPPKKSSRPRNLPTPPADQHAPAHPAADQPQPALIIIPIHTHRTLPGAVFSLRETLQFRDEIMIWCKFV